MNIEEKLNLKYRPHWAIELQSGDICRCMIRHSNDGLQNVSTTRFIIINNFTNTSEVTGVAPDSFGQKVFTIPYNELSKI